MVNVNLANQNSQQASIIPKHAKMLKSIEMMKIIGMSITTQQVTDIPSVELSMLKTFKAKLLMHI